MGDLPARRSTAGPALRILIAGCLAAASLGAAERDAPALAFLARPAAGARNEPACTSAFQADVLRDLRGSGAFRLVEDPGQETFSPATWKASGADLLVRATSRTLASGRLAMTCECIELKTQAVLLRRIFLGEARALDSLAHRFAGFVIGKLADGAAAVPSFVFSRALGGGLREIFGADRDGAHIRQLTTLKSVSTHPAVSRDGKLAFVTYVSGPPQIWAQARPSGPLVRLFPRGSEGGLGLSDLAWSPDGGRLAFVQADRKGGSAVLVLDVALGRAWAVTGPGHSATGPTWNPSGDTLALVSDLDGTRQVYTVGADGRNLRRITSDPSPKVCAAWNPAGDRIAVAAEGAGLFTLTPDGGNRRPLVFSGGAVASLAWTPRGGRLLVGVDKGGDISPCLLNADGSVQDLLAGLRKSAGSPWNAQTGSIVSTKAELSAFHPGSAPTGGSPFL